MAASSSLFALSMVAFVACCSAASEGEGEGDGDGVDDDDAIALQCRPVSAALHQNIPGVDDTSCDVDDDCVQFSCEVTCGPHILVTCFAGRRGADIGVSAVRMSDEECPVAPDDVVCDERSSCGPQGPSCLNGSCVSTFADD